MTLITEETKVFIDHNVYILGAGFSADANVPMVKDFLHKMRASLNWLKAQGNREREVNAIREVLEFRKVAASAAFRVNLNIENIEDLFSLAAASGRYPLAQSVSAAIAGTIDYARRTGDILSFDTYVGGSFQKPPSWMATNEESDAARYLIPAYDLYAGLLSGRACSPGRFMRNTIITFNYDTVLEESLVTWKTPFSYGFRPRSVEYDHSSKSVPDNQTDTLRVLKLHGSVNWANQGRTKIRVYDNYSDVLASGYPVVLIPPTWRKVFSRPLSDVWDAAVQALSEATRIVIIGFSIPPTDMHVKYLIAAGLRENISLRNIYCFNPAPEVEKNLYKILREDLKDQGIAEYHQLPTINLCLGMTGTYQSAAALFNRALSQELRDMRPDRTALTQD